MAGIVTEAPSEPLSSHATDRLVQLCLKLNPPLGHLEGSEAALTVRRLPGGARSYYALGVHTMETGPGPAYWLQLIRMTTRFKELPLPIGYFLAGAIIMDGYDGAEVVRGSSRIARSSLVARFALTQGPTGGWSGSFDSDLSKTPGYPIGRVEWVGRSRRSTIMTRDDYDGSILTITRVELSGLAGKL